MIIIIQEHLPKLKDMAFQIVRAIGVPNPLEGNRPTLIMKFQNTRNVEEIYMLLEQDIFFLKKKEEEEKEKKKRGEGGGGGRRREKPSHVS